MNLCLLSPELLLCGGAILALLGETIWTRVTRGWAFFGAAVLVAAALLALRTPAGAIGGMFVADGVSQFLKVLGALTGLLTVGLSLESRELSQRELPWGTFTALLLFLTAGVMLLVSASDFLSLIVALELIGVASFILTGFLKADRRSGEAAMKYFLVGAFSAGVMLYGISIYYGLFGTTAFEALRTADLAAVPKLPLAGAVFFILVGFGYKVAMVPFHMWVPDVYEGAPLPVTAYISVAPKAAAFGALLRALPDLGALNVAPAVALLAALTMTVGNVGALKQTNAKRLLGYSSVAQMGYVLMGVVAGGKSGTAGVLLYVLLYLFTNMGAFACVAVVTNDAKTEDLDAFAGLSKRSFPLALATAAFFLSLTGLPPMAGFVGKFALFSAAVEHKWIWLAAVAAANSAISFYYYFGIVRRMFLQDPSRSERVALGASLAGCVVVPLLVILWAGLFPTNVLNWVRGVLP
jgi:NADH-quinone oxidoreductase subunit N